MVNNAAAPVLYRNDGGNHNDWLRVRVVGVDSNRDGIGTRLWLHEELGGPVQMRDIGSATHFLGQSELTAHFGLGDGNAPIALLQVAWPSGLVQELVDVPRNQTLILVEGDCLDGDGDGFCEDVDCDDTDPDVHPAAVDRPGDSLDENCDGVPACDPDAKWKHHKLVDCVVKECRALTRAHLLSKKECREIVHDVAYCPDGHAAKHHGKHRGKHHGKKHGKHHGKHHRKDHRDHCEPVHHGKKHGKG